MADIEEVVQMYDKWERDDHKATDINMHGLKSNEPLFHLFRFVDWRNVFLLSLLSHLTTIRIVFEQFIVRTTVHGPP